MKQILQRMGNYLKRGFQKFCTYQNRQCKAVGKEILDKHESQELYHLFEKGRISVGFLDDVYDHLSSRQQFEVDGVRISGRAYRE